MKKLLCIFASAILMCTSAFADEGMWLLPLLEKMNGKAMTGLGCRLSADDIYSINHSSLKDAVVIFGGGCTAEMISREGLLVTNHHCGYSSIQSLSTPEHNYLEDGFWAMNRGEEIPAPGLSVTFLKSFTDVTSVVNGAYKKALKDGDEKAARNAQMEAIKSLEQKSDEDNPNCKSTVTSFYNDNVYYLIVYKIYKDIRLVGTPPASSGKFGGETDNWMWPRHTCDFSMFRVYAGADNEPADYSEDNVPYVPERSLSISLKGYKEGDFAMIMGYPGYTQRFQTASQLQNMVENNAIRVKARTARQEVMWAEMRADETVSLQYANKYASSANGWKKWQGMEQSFKKLNIIERQREEEEAFLAWVSKNKTRQTRYGSAISEIDECVAGSAETGKAANLLYESAGMVELAGAYSRFDRAFQMAKKAEKSDDEALAAAKAALKSLYKDYNSEVDKKITKRMLAFYRDNAKSENYLTLEGRDFGTMDIDEYVDWLFANSAFVSPESVDSSIDSKDAADADPAAKLTEALKAAMKNIMGEYANPAGNSKLQKASKAYTAGQLEWKKGQPSYPDANFTMRLTYGSVKSYSPKDAVIYKYYTTLDGVMEKEDETNYEFRVPAALKEIYKTKDYGQYTNEKGEMPACFLINCDITGGNSGSPVMDADGNLIGLAFDGNWESMSSDVMFEPEFQRCICVDIRYVLLMMDKFGGAGYLLDEMNLVK